jgi:hypothetical protein
MKDRNIAQWTIDKKPNKPSASLDKIVERNSKDA